jgi:hypothetical protein
MAPTFIERMAAARYHRAPIEDPSPSQAAPGPSSAGADVMRACELERTLDDFIEECVRNRWTRGNPKAIRRAEELGVQEFIGRVPATLTAMDLPKRGQARFVRHSDLDTWHTIIWVSETSVHRPLCNLVGPYPKHARGQSRRPKVSPYDSPVCRSCGRKLEKLAAAGQLPARGNGDITGSYTSLASTLSPEARKRLAADLMPRFSPV